MLELSPNKIQFTDNNQFNITIRNTLTDSAVAFKWMLTTPKSYTVKPRMGTIPAGESIDVVVIRLQPTTPKDKFKIQSLAIGTEQDTQDVSLEQLFKDEKNKDKIKSIPLKPVVTQDTAQASSSSSLSNDTTTAQPSSTSASSSAQQQQQQQQQASSSSSFSSWGGWSSDWFSSKIADVVHTVQDSANALGTKIQHFVDDDYIEQQERLQQQQQSQQSQQQQEQPSEQEQQQQEEEPTAQAQPQAQQQQEESVIMDVIETAEKSFFSLVGWGKETLEKVREAEEIQNLKRAATTLTEQTKSATLSLYDQLAANLNIIKGSQDDALLRVTFEDLFREGNASLFYERLNSLSMRSQQRLDAMLNGGGNNNLGKKRAMTMKVLSSSDRKRVKAMLREIDALLQTDECWSDQVPPAAKDMIGGTSNGRELLSLIVNARTMCEKALSNYREVSNNDGNNSNSSSLSEHVQTGVIVIEKLRAEYLRTLANFAGKSFEQVSQLSQLVYQCKDLDQLEIPEQWTTSEQTEKDKDLSTYQRLAHLMRNYSLFTTSQLVQVANEYVTTARAILAVIDAEYNRVASEENNGNEDDEALSSTVNHLRDRATTLVNNLVQSDVPQYTSKDTSIVRETCIFFAHVLKYSVAQSVVEHAVESETTAPTASTTTTEASSSTTTEEAPTNQGTSSGAVESAPSTSEEAPAAQTTTSE